MPLVLALLICSLGCEVGTEIVYVDPPVVINDEYYIEPVTGDPTVFLGLYVEQLYQDLETGSALPVVWGLQGGTWTMPCIRIVGIASRATVDCSLTMVESGEVVGSVKAKTNFFLAADGYLEYHSFPIPVNHENKEDDIDDLYNQNAALKCSVTDDEKRSDEMTVLVELIKG